MPSGVDVIFSVIDGIGFVVQWFWWVFVFAALLVMKIKWRNWQVEAIIIEKRGSNLIKTNDRAGKYHDPYTSVTGYRLQKSKDTIPVIDYDWVLHNNFKPTNILEWITNKLRGNIGTIFLYRYGTKQYKPINIKEKGKNKMVLRAIKDKEGNSVYVNVYKQLDPRDKLAPLDFEVVDWDNMNFMVQEQRASILRRQKSGEFIKALVVPLVFIGAAVIVSIVMIKLASDYALSIRGSPTPSTPPEQNPSPDIPFLGDLIPGQ